MCCDSAQDVASWEELSGKQMTSIIMPSTNDRKKRQNMVHYTVYGDGAGEGELDGNVGSMGARPRCEAAAISYLTSAWLALSP